MRIGGRLVASVAFAALLLVLALPGAVLANGVGDLYAASSAGVLEIHVVASRVVNTVPIVPSPTSLAFAPDGRTLFVASGGSHVTPIDIETLEPGEPIALPAATPALAFPNGDVLVAALPVRRTLGLLRPASGQVTETAALPGPGNLLAADRHDARVVVAEAGKGWLAVVDTANPTVRSTTVAGSITAIAIDRDRGGVLVATAAPNAVVRLDLASLKVSWKASLGAAPTAVAALVDGAVAATGTSLWRVGTSGPKAWATAKGSVFGLAPSDEGKVLHLLETGRIQALDTSGKAQREIALTAGRLPTALAAVPAGSSLFTGAARATSSPAGSGGTGAASGPPVTSTIVDAAQRMMDQPPVQGALTVAVLILGVCWLSIRWWDRRAA